MKIQEMRRSTGRPKEGYKNREGKKIPGCTTIISRFKDSSALIYWAWGQGREGKDINESRDSAADAGSCAHEMIDCHLHGETFKTALWEPITIRKAEHCFIAFLDWLDQSRTKLEFAEISLVSEVYQFGGTFDAIINSRGLYLLDYKTSNAIYEDYLIQVAGGYAILWGENYPERTLSGIQLLRISKPKHPDDPVMFEHRQWSAEIFPVAKEQFLLYRRAYELDKRLKGML